MTTTILVAALLATGSAVQAQNLINFDTIAFAQNDLEGGSGRFASIEIGGSPQYFPYFGMFGHVGSGSGTGASLVGQDFLLFCVNFNYASPVTGVDYTHSTDGGSLSYDPDPYGSVSGDLWGVHRTEKFNAIRDIVATYGSILTALDPNEAEFQRRMVALNFAFAEIVADYDATLASLDLGAGAMQFYDGSLNPLAASLDPSIMAVHGYYQEAIAAIGNGKGDGYVLNAASIAGADTQDTILIPLVPEPSAMLLGALALVVPAFRRKRD